MSKINLALACGCGAMALALSACGGGAEEAPAAEEEAAAPEEAEAAPSEAPAAAEEASDAPAEEVASAPADPIRGPGGLEEKCLDRVNETVGGGVIGTNRIEEAESGVMIYVNVQGAAAPWQCFGTRDGAIYDVYFGGDEGAL